ncbi:MAG: hypothetical protein WB783_01095 [Arenicellales bacterium]
MTLTAPPHWAQDWMSILNTRLRRWAQAIAMDGMYAGFAGAKAGHGRAALAPDIITGEKVRASVVQRDAGSCALMFCPP